MGEMGTIDRALRNATVCATSKVKVIFFTQSQVKQLRKDLPAVDEKLQKILKEREGSSRQREERAAELLTRMGGRA